MQGPSATNPVIVSVTSRRGQTTISLEVDFKSSHLQRIGTFWGGAVVAASIAGISLVMVTPLLGFLALPALTLASRRIDRWSQEKSQSDLSELGTTFDALVSLVEEHLEEVA